MKYLLSLFATEAKIFQIQKQILDNWCRKISSKMKPDINVYEKYSPAQNSAPSTIEDQGS